MRFAFSSILISYFTIVDSLIPSSVHSVGISFENEKITNLNLSGVGVKKITFYNILKTILLIILIVVLLFIALFFYFIFDSERKKRKRKQDKLKRSLGIKKDI